jgi:itaconate CoA-transferase
VLPLRGVTVLSLEHAVAAPFATRQLADLGARVIKVERPGSGDFARQYDESVNGESRYFVWLNRSKESVALDVKSPQGREILHELAERPLSTCRTSDRARRGSACWPMRCAPAIPARSS